MRNRPERLLQLWRMKVFGTVTTMLSFAARGHHREAQGISATSDADAVFCVAELGEVALNSSTVGASDEGTFFEGLLKGSDNLCSSSSCGVIRSRKGIFSLLAFHFAVLLHGSD